ncbi:MAG: hypothetical protein IJU75_01960, partial [Clostridia bacterium]|nr:hypothetical protein [Clostridia bacterium]
DITEMKEVMGDLVWFIIIGILFAALGALFVRLGLLIRYGQRTDLIIKYHCDKVSEENKKAYCALAGTGVLIIGAGFLVSGVCAFLVRSALSLAPMALGLLAGIVLLILASAKYNRRQAEEKP